MKIVTILGARPQFIKAGSVSREINKRINDGVDITEIIVHTGQHYDQNMSDVFFNELEIPKPKYSLGIGGKSHGAMTGQMIEHIEKVLVSEVPDWVMVYGDTNSTLAGALAASKLNIKIAHVEAGLRSYNMQMPEEINRILTDRVSSILFCPNKNSAHNLNKEGLVNWNTNSKIVLSGDVMQDGAIFYLNKAIKPSNIRIESTYVLATIHRAENTDNHFRLKEIIEGLNHIAEDMQVILPLHPRTKKILNDHSFDTKNLTIIDSVGYLNMVWLIANSSLIITDSGGLQKEAYFLSIPCITCRDETEWIELVECGANILVGANRDKIIKSYKHISTSRAPTFSGERIYGNGLASKIIIDELLGL
jgi:UDP-GlcNAc3NAcA epimerase